MSAALTGYALRTAHGGRGETLDALLGGVRAARPSARYDGRAYGCALQSVIPGPSPSGREGRYLHGVALHGVAVAREALARSGRSGGARLGLFAGVGGLRVRWEEVLGPLASGAAQALSPWEAGLARLHPHLVLRNLSNNAHALLAAELDARGEGVTFGGGVAGASAVRAAVRALEAGAVDAALVVAYDTLVEPGALVDLAARGELSPSESPAAPYDVAASGRVPGEAAGALVLERPGDAGARTLARVDARAGSDGRSGWPSSGLLARLARALSLGGEVLDGAGRARPDLDLEEREALAGVLGEGCPLGCVTASVGALGAAGPVVQIVALVEQLSAGWLAPIVGLREAPRGRLVPLRELTRVSARAGLGVSASAPGLGAAVRVEVPW